MSTVESAQVKLRLVHDSFVSEEGVKGTEILKQLKQNKRISNDADGPYVAMQFDSHEFRFRPGKYVTVPKTAGRALLRESGIIIGSALTGPLVPFLEIFDEFQLGEQLEVEKKPATACPICGEDQLSFPRLTRHLMAKHKDQMKEDPEANEAKWKQDVSKRKVGEENVEEEVS